ncbi:hypothetical protein K466DRAFT_590586 [Polyporus arcularius HHB13444]|uniref:Uncharacterized protein n=1 Tax=Polyporus arcularius HHB13444 TaxID=1314778 RepID=A0A5C3P0J2_9APHY|nr:hypothetical protein K466DRAFT_590586 [Polyporus arcularius HHB13444]
MLAQRRVPFAVLPLRAPSFVYTSTEGQSLLKAQRARGLRTGTVRTENNFDDISSASQSEEDALSGEDTSDCSEYCALDDELRADTSSNMMFETLRGLRSWPPPSPRRVGICRVRTHRPGGTSQTTSGLLSLLAERYKEEYVYTINLTIPGQKGSFDVLLDTGDPNSHFIAKGTKRICLDENNEMPTGEFDDWPPDHLPNGFDLRRYHKATGIYAPIAVDNPGPPADAGSDILTYGDGAFIYVVRFKGERITLRFKGIVPGDLGASEVQMLPVIAYAVSAPLSSGSLGFGIPTTPLEMRTSFPQSVFGVNPPGDDDKDTWLLDVTTPTFYVDLRKPGPRSQSYVHVTEVFPEPKLRIRLEVTAPIPAAPLSPDEGDDDLALWRIGILSLWLVRFVKHGAMGAKRDVECDKIQLHANTIAILDTGTSFNSCSNAVGKQIRDWLGNTDDVPKEDTYCGGNARPLDDWDVVLELGEASRELQRTGQVMLRFPAKDFLTSPWPVDTKQHPGKFYSTFQSDDKLEPWSAVLGMPFHWACIIKHSYDTSRRPEVRLVPRHEVEELNP